MRFSSLDGALGANQVTQSIDNMVKKSRTNGNVDDLTSTFNSVTFLDDMIITKDGNTNVVHLQVQTHAVNTRSIISSVIREFKCW